MLSYNHIYYSFCGERSKPRLAMIRFFESGYCLFKIIRPNEIKTGTYWFTRELYGICEAKYRLDNTELTIDYHQLPWQKMQDDFSKFLIKSQEELTHVYSDWEKRQRTFKKYNKEALEIILNNESLLRNIYKEGNYTGQPNPEGKSKEEFEDDMLLDDILDDLESEWEVDDGFSDDFENESSAQITWTCSLCDGDSETGCMWHDPTECPRR